MRQIFATIFALLSIFIFVSNSHAAVTTLDPQANLIRESAEQNLELAALYNEHLLKGTGGDGVYNETYLGIKNFWSNDIISNFFANIGQVTGRWLAEWTYSWVPSTAGFLTSLLHTFVLNPNIATSIFGDDISPLIRSLAAFMQGIALDLLLLLFILAIWRYWTEAAWRNGAGVMGAVGRLILVCGITLAWPTICAIEIQLSNEMIQAIFTQPIGQPQILDKTISTAFSSGVTANNSLAAPTIGGFISGIGLIIFFILGLILIVQLIVMLLMKAVQMAVLIAQYLFAPLFLVFLATPDTAGITSGFIKSCIEVSLWSFIWIGLLKIMSILFLSAFNPWGQILMAIAILQMMIQVPSFLSRMSISPLSGFISSGLGTKKFISQGTAALGKTILDKSKDIFNETMGWKSSNKTTGEKTNNPILNTSPKFENPMQTQSRAEINNLPYPKQTSEASQTTTKERSITHGLKEKIASSTKKSGIKRNNGEQNADKISNLEKISRSAFGFRPIGSKTEMSLGNYVSAKIGSRSNSFFNSHNSNPHILDSHESLSSIHQAESNNSQDFDKDVSVLPEELSLSKFEAALLTETLINENRTFDSSDLSDSPSNNFSNTENFAEHSVNLQNETSKVSQTDIGQLNKSQGDFFEESGLILKYGLAIEPTYPKELINQEKEESASKINSQDSQSESRFNQTNHDQIKENRQLLSFPIERYFSSTQRASSKPWIYRKKPTRQDFSASETEKINPDKELITWPKNQVNL